MSYVCRTCLLSDDDEMESIYTTKCINEENISISEMIALCVGLEISKYDNFTDVICNSCLYILIAAFNYRSTCWESQKRLLHQFDQDKVHLQQKTTYVFESINCRKNLVKEKKAVDVVEIINCAKDEVIIIEDDENYIEKPISYEPFVTPPVLQTHVHSELSVDNNYPEKTIDVLEHTNCTKNLVEEEKTTAVEIINCSKDVIIVDDENCIENAGNEKLNASYENDVIAQASQILTDHAELTLDKTTSARGKRYNYRTCDHFVVIPNGFTCSFCVKINVKPSIVKKQETATNKGVIYGETIFKCKYCAYRSTKNRKIILHQRRLHMGNKPNLCHFCGKGFLNNIKQLEHMATHSKPQIECSVCKKKCGSRIVYKEHVATHKLSEQSIHRKINTEEKNRICKLCGTGFVKQLSLQKHMKSYHNQTVDM